jgi:hypothetical protein
MRIRVVHDTVELRSDLRLGSTGGQIIWQRTSAEVSRPATMINGFAASHSYAPPPYRGLRPVSTCRPADVRRSVTMQYGLDLSSWSDRKMDRFGEEVCTELGNPPNWSVVQGPRPADAMNGHRPGGCTSTPPGSCSSSTTPTAHEPLRTPERARVTPTALAIELKTCQPRRTRFDPERLLAK